MKRYLFLIVTILSGLLINSQTIDTQKSEVSFQIKGGGIFKVKGTFTGFTGDFSFNENDLENSSFSICIDTKTVDSNNKKRDEHLRKEDFFNVEQYPNICFESIEVLKTSDGYKTRGKLTILGITNEVEIPFSFNNNVFTGNIIVNRFDFNLGKDYGTFKVGKEANVSIKCEVY